MSLLQKLTTLVTGRAPVVTRVAPSPTGQLHVGTARTALFNYLWAQKHGGKFILRVEDTDRQRSSAAHERDIQQQLQWLGISWDEQYRQSERTGIYQRALEGLVASDAAYRSREPAKDDPSAEVEVIRLRNPGTTITFTDAIRGEVTFETDELGDFVIARSMTEPLYHLAVVVDDEQMGVTDVIRGEDHISNTPRQILIQRALGYGQPRYAHIPLILNADRSKLSKRAGGATIAEYQDAGYIPEALVNYLALLGWNPGDDREFFTMDELTTTFELTGIQKGGAVFDTDKLDWFNRAYIKQLSDDRLLAGVEAALPDDVRALPGYNTATLRRMLPIFRERLDRFGDVTELARDGELTYYFVRPTYEDPNALIWKDSDCPATRTHLTQVIDILQSTSAGAFTESHLKDILWDYATQEGRGAVLWPMRYALSGQRKSPDPFVLASILSKKETLARLHAAHDALEPLCPSDRT